MGDVQSPSVVCFDPKKGEENFARLCQFLMTICGDILRVVLSHHIKPADLRSQLDLNQSKMCGKTNAQEKDLLFPPHTSTTSSPPIRSKDFDISLLYKILRNLCCNISKHRAGWGNPPDSGDYTLSACIERIRLMRNSISGHSINGTIDDVQFEDYWQELKTSVVEIEKDVIGSDKYERMIDHLHDCNLNPTKAKEYVDQIRKIRGEVSIKRERIDMVESACIEIGEEISAKKVRLDGVEKSVSDIKEILKATKDEFMRELQSSEKRIQQKINVRLEKSEQNQADLIKILTADSVEILREMKEIKMQQQLNDSKNTHSERTATARFQEIEVSTTIKFKGFHFSTGICSLSHNKCWVLVNSTEGNSSMYLINDSNVIKKVDIPDQYYHALHYSNITTNDKGEAVFISGQSVIAVTQDGTVYKLFDFPFTPLYRRLCFLHSGNYITIDCASLLYSSLCIHEFNSDGIHVRDVTTEIKLDNSFCQIRQNNNRDIAISDERQLITLAADDFRTKHRVPLAESGVVVPYMNSRSDLLYGHGKTIDLLTSNGQFVKTVYTAQKEKQIANIACSGNGTVWILHGSGEVEILKLEI